jgi:cob(I)alamin adenosyltransferase
MPTDRAPKIYTRTGDKGKTSLIGGTRVSKSNLRLDAYGTIDELNSVIGVLQHDIKTEFAGRKESGELAQVLSAIQNELFDVGSQLACEDVALRKKLPSVGPERITELELLMDRFTLELKPLKNFILPGGSRSAGFAHIARTVCRRAERLCVALQELGVEASPDAESGSGSGSGSGSASGSGSGDPGHTEVDAIVVQFINRLSDFLFVLARYLNHLLGVDEPIWKAKKT